MKSAVVFLTTIPQHGTIWFAEKIKKKLGHDVYIIIDQNKYDPEIGGDITYIRVSEEFCEKNGYINSNISDNATHIRKNPIAMDKFLLFFCENKLPYDFVWVFEDDVFIPSLDVFKNLDAKYSKYDLVTPNNYRKNDNALDWHWRHVVDKISPPYYYSMVSAMGLSKNMLGVIKEYVDKHKSLFYIEVMFNTLAMKNRLSVIDAMELKSIVWMGEWGLDEFLLLPDNIFHPIKSIEEHQILRDAIIQFKAENYNPINRLPDFVKNQII
jgi:hypothetical protein